MYVPLLILLLLACAEAAKKVEKKVEKKAEKKGHLKPNKATGKMDFDMEVYLDAAIMLIRAAKKAAPGNGTNPLNDRIGLDDEPELGEPELDKPGLGEPEPDKSGPDKPKSKNPEPEKSEPDNPEPEKPGPGEPELKKPEPDMQEPKKSEPDKSEPKKPEPDKAEPKKPELAEPEGAKEVSSGCPRYPMDCEELLLECNQTKSGVFRVYPRSRVGAWGKEGFEAFCDMDTDGGGWTVIQRRGDFGASPDFFFKDWETYKEGFGDLKSDHWLGNDKIFALSNQRRSTLRFDLTDFEDGSGFATYKDFYVDDESGAYRLHLGNFDGNIGDSFTAHKGSKFTTKDKDNDNNSYSNCASLYKGGWWYNNCHTVNLNGLYLKGKHTSYANGVNWYNYKGFYYSLQRTEMKVRSVDFEKASTT